MRLYDAHNHLQDARLGPDRARLVTEARAAGVARMVVNGSTEEDWGEVAALARQFPGTVIPSFGLHPWYLRERTAGWEAALAAALDASPGAVIGEIGLDRWLLGCTPAVRAAIAPRLDALDVPSLAEQEEVFAAQFRLAAVRGLPASIHCLQAWGRLQDMLRELPRPTPGFLLHSYGGPAEMIASLVKLGAHFSFPGYFLHARKARQREAFKLVPVDRLLVETDAPDQLLPDAMNRHPLRDAAGRALNHPANLAAVYEGLAALRLVPLAELAGQVEDNFRRLFPGA
ncbi:MAG: TatD family hydrolase [Limisphaerales bacterium]